MVSTSLKPARQLLVEPPIWIPNPAEWSNYTVAAQSQPLFLYIGNSMIISTLSVIGALISNAVIAYGFARIEWKGRDLLFGLVLATLMLPYHVVMIPLFVTFSKIGWVNTWNPLIVPVFLGNPFFIFLLRQFMKGIPMDLTDAARIDGASEWDLLTRIVLPLCKPALASVALFQFLWSWNDFMGPLIYISDTSKYPISLGLALYRNSQGITNFAVLMAAAAMAMVPIVVLFFALQRFFVRGISMTGLRG